jgi:beta-glucanase (GH16 family)
VLAIEGRKEKVSNPKFDSSSTEWRNSREFAEYTSASIQTKGLQQWKFGRFEIRARIDTAKGAWPAIWTLGAERSWPDGGEVDLMEFYRLKGVPTILANIAWGSKQPNVPKWDMGTKPLTYFTNRDSNWVSKFHVWRMDWNKDSINLYLDDELLNTALPNETLNADSTNPFLQPHFLLLNLALGGHGGDPSNTQRPIKFEVDYVRVYQKKNK